MKFWGVLLVTCLGASAFASDRIEGAYVGEGVVDSAFSDTASAASLTLGVRFAPDDALEIIECWDTHDGSPEAKACIASRYEIREESLYDNDRKVGDIFPGRIIVMIANSQVAEQLRLEKRAGDSVRYEYTYVNVDGAATHRKGLLKKAN